MHASRTAQPAIGQLQKSADAVARAIGTECSKLLPVERRELLVQMIEWTHQRIAAFDASDRSVQTAIARPTLGETQTVAGSFGKGTRSSDAL